MSIHALRRGKDCCLVLVLPQPVPGEIILYSILKSNNSKFGNTGDSKVSDVELWICIVSLFSHPRYMYLHPKPIAVKTGVISTLGNLLRLIVLRGGDGHLV